MPRFEARLTVAAPKRCSDPRPPLRKPRKSRETRHGTEAAPFLRAFTSLRAAACARSRCLSHKRAERASGGKTHAHRRQYRMSFAPVDGRARSTRPHPGLGGRRPAPEQGRHRLDAHRHGLGAADVGPRAGALLRGTRAHQEHAVGAHAGVRGVLAGHRTVVHLRLLARVHAGQLGERRLQPAVPPARSAAIPRFTSWCTSLSRRLSPPSPAASSSARWWSA
jgi:hypothetical protein